jgi:DNA-binding transcriptional LysR family regulator
MIALAYDGSMLADIEIRQLRALQAVAGEGSFGRAAERLGFTQSAISQQIAALERAVGDRVFDRPGGPKRVEITPVGQLLLAHAEAMLAQLAAAEDDLRSLRRGEVGRLLLGSYQSVSVKILPDVIGRLRVERPGLTIRCLEGVDDDDLLAKLLADEIDLTFLTAMPTHDGVEAVELLVDPFVLISAADGTVPPRTPDELAGSALIGQTPCACQAVIDERLRELGVQPDYVFRTNDNSAVQAMVRAGLGRAILPYLAIDQHDPGIVVSLLEPSIQSRTICLARRRGRTLVPAADRFVELATAVCRALPPFEPVGLVAAR